MTTARQGFGIEALDRELGGGLLPGTLTVIAGATGIGKTQLGLRWADAGAGAEGSRGVICDLTSRGDSQNHGRTHACSLAGRCTLSPDSIASFEQVWDWDRPLGAYYHPIERAGRRVSRADLDPDAWHEWKAELAKILRCSVGFFYQHFIRGVRRVVFDGLEPTDRFSESIQFEFFEYIYHHVLRKDSDWAAREWFREQFRAHAAPGGRSSLRSSRDRVPLPLHDASCDARRSAGPADRAGRHLLQRQHDHPDGTDAA